jgi:secreted Zn-dependent insulinase-like peptidase
MASEAGITGEITARPNHLFLAIDGYVDMVETYISDYFGKMLSFEVDEKMFQSAKDDQLRNFTSSL